MEQLALLAVCLVIAGALYWRRRRRRLRLEWPATMGYQQLSDLVDGYLKHHGWSIQTAPIAIHFKIVKRDKQVVRMTCQPSLVEYNGTKIRDLSQTALVPGPKPLVCITTNEVPRHFRSVAASGQVLLLHYKDLAMFAAGEDDQGISLEAMRSSLLESVREAE